MELLAGARCWSGSVRGGRLVLAVEESALLSISRGAGGLRYSTYYSLHLLSSSADRTAISL